jgi:S-adenosylmethionine hydrolase
MLVRRAKNIRAYEITWRPDRLSNSFHGRDLFAPVCGKLSRGHRTEDWANELSPDSLVTPAWPEDLLEIVYIDSYGNAVTGVRAAVISEGMRLEVAGRQCVYQRVFAEGHNGVAFWYENANGLVEIAVSGGSAQDSLGIEIGDALYLVE